VAPLWRAVPEEFGATQEGGNIGDSPTGAEESPTVRVRSSLPQAVGPLAIAALTRMVKARWQKRTAMGGPSLLPMCERRTWVRSRARPWNPTSSSIRLRRVRPEDDATPTSTGRVDPIRPSGTPRSPRCWSASFPRDAAMGTVSVKAASLNPSGRDHRARNVADEPAR